MPPRDTGLRDTTVSDSDGMPRDGNDAAAEAGPPPCGTLGAACCEGAQCGGTLQCRAGVCFCGTNADCNGASCRADGRCLETLASGQYNPDAIAVDANRVYWIDRALPGQGLVMAVPRTGGASITLARGQSGPASLVTDGSHVYWWANNAIMSVPCTGGTPSTVVSAHATFEDATALSYYGAIALGGDLVFGVTTVNDDEVDTIRKADGTLSVLATGVSGGSIAVDGTDVYVASEQIVKIPRAGGAPVTLANAGSPVGLSVYGASVYWVDQEIGAEFPMGVVVQVASSGGTPTTLASGLLAPTSIAVDDTSVYWTVSNAPQTFTGTVAKVATSGGTPVTLATGQGNPVASAVDQTSLYWANYDGTVMRLTPK